MNIPATLLEQVESIKELELSYRTLHESAIISDSYSNRVIQVPFLSITNKYKDYLSTIVQSEELNNFEQERYMFQPKTVSLDFYGTTEFWNDILILNNCYSVTTFKPKVLKFYDPKRLKVLLNEILILESNIN